ncbi:hypothetical protein [[Eubacterium] cellulosolvens]
MINRVWYASYGSNLLRRRFMCYIQGGTPEGTKTEFKGCLDSSPPQDMAQIIIPHQLYFAERSSTWQNGGVAFIKWCRDVHAGALGRMYLIKPEQFAQVVRQENAHEPDDNTIKIDFVTTISTGATQLQARWYSRIMYLGTNQGYPIFTFTATRPDEDIILNPPSVEYLQTIIKGIQETYAFSDEKIFSYIKNLEGVKNQINAEKILNIIRATK